MPTRPATESAGGSSCARSDGSQTSKRGFTSQRTAANARRRLVEQVERREVVHTTETFGFYWERWLARRRPYLEEGTWTGYEISGRKRLLPAFANKRLGALFVDDIRAFVSEQAEAVEAGELGAKTVNNALVTLVVCLNEAVEDGLIVANPALRVERLPAPHIERAYVRLHEIPIYLDSCSDLYRPLAEVLMGSEVRISEALALHIGDLELDGSGGVIVVYRSRKKATVGSTKSDRFRSVEIGPRTSLALRTQIARRREFDTGLDNDVARRAPASGCWRTPSGLGSGQAHAHVPGSSPAVCAIVTRQVSTAQRALATSLGLSAWPIQGCVRNKVH